MNNLDEVHSGHVQRPPRDNQEKGRRLLEGVSSTAKVLQVSFRYRGEPFEQLTHVLARTNVNAPGCVWKTWLTSKDRSEAGVIYLFEDGAALERFLKGPVINDLRHQKGVFDVSAKTFSELSETQLLGKAPVCRRVQTRR